MRCRFGGRCALAVVAATAAVALVGAAAEESAVPNSAALVNERVTRRIDASKPIVRVSLTLRVRATEDTQSAAPASARSLYYLAMPNAMASRLAHLDARGDAETGNAAASYVVRSAPEVKRPGYTHFVVELPQPLSSDASHSFKVIAWFTHVLTPLPKVIEQHEKQFLVIEASANFASPYLTEQETTIFKLGGRRVEDYTVVEPVAEERGNIKYGPFKSTSPYTARPVRVHFENSIAFPTMREVEREVEVSHWGNVAVEEHYALVNTGAKLKNGLFSRVDYQIRGMRANVLSSMAAILPHGASDIYYRDIIGNISTSNVRLERKGVRFEMQPRFPIMGGYQTEWYQGYNLPSEDALVYDSATGEYTLTFKFNIPYMEASVDDFVTKIVLPEGANVQAVETPSAANVVEEARSRRFTYLDFVVGRPVIVLRAKNIVRQHTGDVRVTYTMPSMYLLREPLILVATFFALFVAYSIVSRVDLSITPAKPAKKAKAE